MSEIVIYTQPKQLKVREYQGQKVITLVDLDEVKRVIGGMR